MARKPYVADAISAINPDATFSVGGITGLDNIEWFGDTQPIPVADIQAKLDELVAAWEAKQYQRERQYPSIAEQLDMQYWDSINGTTTWADAIAAVKAANPKPE